MSYIEAKKKYAAIGETFWRGAWPTSSFLLMRPETETTGINRMSRVPFWTGFSRKSSSMGGDVKAATMSVSLLGSDREISWRCVGGAVEIDMPLFRQGAAPCDHALVFKIEQ